jgi:hypothetical protein
VYWQLPGPRRFLERVAADVANAVVVVLALPPTMPADELEPAVAGELDHLRSEVIHVSDLDPAAPLVASLAGALGVDAARTPATAADLIATGVLDGALLWISGVETMEPVQREQLFSVAQQLLGACDDARLLTGIALCLERAADAPGLENDARLRVHSWWGVVGRLDAAVLVASVSDTADTVAQAVAVELAGPDLALAAQLAVLTEDAWALEEACIERARDLGIERDLLSDSSPRSLRKAGGPWAAGAIDLFDGDPYWHSGLLVMNHQRRALERRLWSAHTRSLLPRMDLLRSSLVDTAVKRGLLTEWQRDDGTEIEFSDISRRFARDPGLPHPVRELARWLHETRNRLAHLHPIAPTALLEGRRLAKAASYDGALR